MGGILIFITGFLIGFAYMYYSAKDDIRKAKNLEHLKIKYSVEDKNNEL